MCRFCVCVIYIYIYMQKGQGLFCHLFHSVFKLTLCQAPEVKGTGSKHEKTLGPAGKMRHTGVKLTFYNHMLNTK